MKTVLANYYNAPEAMKELQLSQERTHFLISLLHRGENPVAPRTREEQLESQGISFAGSFFAVAHVVLIAVDAFAFISSLDGRAYSEDQLVVAFKGLVQPLLPKGSYLFEIQREIILLCSGKTALETEAVLHSTLVQLRALEELLSGIRIFQVYSVPVEGLSSIAQCHAVCHQLRQWRVFHMDVTPMLGPEAMEYPLPVTERGRPARRDIALEDAILLDFKAGRYREARNTLRQLFNEDYLALAEPLVLLKHKCVQFLSALAGACMEICDLELTPQLCALQLERRILAAESYPEVRAQMEHCFGHLNDLALIRWKKEQNNWILEVKNYVGVHFADPTMNVNTIADAFEKNAAYLSRSFLQHTGYSLLEYIHRYRIQEAKIRIGRGDPLPYVAEAVGYGSVLTMSRAFKKYEGVTPGKLRS